MRSLTGGLLFIIIILIIIAWNQKNFYKQINNRLIDIEKKLNN
jgi:hypothetical protein